MTVSRGRKSIRIFTTDKAQLGANIRRAGHRELALDLSQPPRRSRRVREQILLGVRRGREFARRVCMMISRRAWPAPAIRQGVAPANMRTQSATTEAHIAAVPACWQREAPSSCLRVELPSGTTHLFPYQHFVTASLERGETGVEAVRITFSSHDLEVEGRGLRELLLDLQELGDKWIRSSPGRYHELPTGTAGLITAIRLIAAE